MQESIRKILYAAEPRGTRPLQCAQVSPSVALPHRQNVAKSVAKARKRRQATTPQKQQKQQHRRNFPQETPPPPPF